MKVQEVKAEIHKGVGEYLLEQGFKLRKSSFEYIRNQGEVSHIYRIQVDAKTEWFHVSTQAFVGCPKVNRIFNEGLQRDIGVTDPTTGFGIRNEHSERGSYNVERFEDIPSVVDKIKSDFADIAVPFFDGIQSLKDLERYMNRRCETGLYRPLSVSNACLGLIAAKLCENPDFNVIFQDYHEFCKQSQGKLAAPILQMKEFLQPSQAGSAPIALLGPKQGE